MYLCQHRAIRPDDLSLEAQGVQESPIHNPYLQGRGKTLLAASVQPEIAGCCTE